MSAQPILETPRLVLRPFSLDDASEVQRMAGDIDVARTTLNIPHPYEPGMAEAWISTHAADWDNGTGMICAVVRRADDRLVGAAGLAIQAEHERAELGYWIGREFWGNGYATEAGRALVQHAFDMGMRRVMARHFGGNIASGRVMQKIGMQQEGVLRQHIRRWGEFHDIVVYGILAGELR